MFLLFCLFTDFPYSQTKTDVAHTIDLPPGYYSIQLCGGQGGSGYRSNKVITSAPGGRGACVSGNLKVSDSTKRLFGRVGGKGSQGGTGPNPGGFNGGGNSGKDTGFWFGSGDASGGGGGATDLRYSKDDLATRIIVAAGGSGGAMTCPGAPGGDIKGRNIGGKCVILQSDIVDQSNGNANGVGGNGIDSGFTPGSGGGGGWRGGPGSGDYAADSPEKAIAHSGSSYISGHTGCSKHTGYVFDNTRMVSSNTDGWTGSGYIQINQLYKCTSPCIDCDSATYCTKCSSGYYLYQRSSTIQTCESKCPDGYYGSGTRCLKCSSPCATCSSAATTCDTCISGYFIYNKKCYSSCPPGTYTSGVECKNCQSPCKTCTGSATTCETCASPYLLYHNQCVLSCPAGTYSTGTKCIECDSPCSTCTGSATTCTACISGFYNYNGRCYSECPSGTYQSGEYCYPCMSPCSSCETSSQFCKSCNDGFYFYQNKCYPQCPLGTIQDGKNCLKCKTGCSECETTVDNCLICQEGFYLKDNRCYSDCSVLNDKTTSYGKNSADQTCSRCSIEFCNSCSQDYTKCTSCFDSHFLNENNQCQIKPTSAFTKSDFFTPSSSFTKSSSFSESSSFTKSTAFSTSFSFTKSSVFSNSNEFTKTKTFSSSTTFTRSNRFTKSNNFTSSSGFSSSSHFTTANPNDQNDNFNSTRGNKSSFPSYMIYIIVAFAAVIICLVFFIIFWKRSRKQNQDQEDEMSSTLENCVTPYQVSETNNDFDVDSLGHEIMDPFNMDMEEVGKIPGNMI